MIAGAAVEPRPRVALVLGAGGIRGCAHAGAIGVLREAGIAIDLVVGASVGSIFGLALAAGTPTERLYAVIRRSVGLELTRFYAGRLRADRRNPIARLVWDAGAGKTFADLSLPFAAVATDMATHRAVPLTTGSVLRAVEASIAVPFIARPVAIDGRYYLDGGLLEAAPVSIARALGADIVIAVCLSGDLRAPAVVRERMRVRAVIEHLGRRPIVGRRLHHQVRFGCRLYAASPGRSRADGAGDVEIWPEFGRISPNALAGTARCLDAGISAAEAALPAIRAAIRGWSHDGRHQRA